MAIPKAQVNKSNRIPAPKSAGNPAEQNIVFSFKAIERNEFFDLDCTCQNWASELFDTMQIVSNANLKEIYSGKYSGNSTLRIHQHKNAHAPCPVPVPLEEMWQIRISKSKGGIHGVFSENIFYVIWFDPLHNLYPDEHYGGLKKISPTTTCCMDRNEEILSLATELKEAKEEITFWKEYVDELENKSKDGASE